MPDPSVPTHALRVVIVDADERLRESLTGLLSIGDRLAVVGSAGTVTDALVLIEAAAPDVVIVDPRLPDAEAGRAFIARLRARWPAVRILAMGWSESLETIARGCGADACLRKTFRPADLIAAVVAGGRPTNAGPAEEGPPLC